MVGVFTVESNRSNTSIPEDLLLRIRRIHKLSEQPPNPGYAYRHLEHIHALCEMIMKEYPVQGTLQTIQNPDPPASGAIPLKPPTPGAALPFRM
jgi:hypothetical protein